MYSQCTFREFLRRYGMLLTQIETRNNQYGGHHTFTFTPALGTEIFGDTKSELKSVFDLYVSSLDYFQYEDITVIRNNGVSFLSAAITLSSNSKITGYENT